MEPAYPLFILEKDDGSIRMVRVEKELSWYEWIDIREGLYAGWDSKGYPVELYQDKKTIKARLISDKPEKEKLRIEILRYAQRYCPDEPFIYRENMDDVRYLFETVQSHVGKKASPSFFGSLIRKSKNFLRRT